jgi:transposase-like protein
MTRNAAKHDALLDELLKDYTDPKDILGEHGLLKQLTKRVVERALAAELTEHLGYAPYVRQAHDGTNCRNGKGKKII